MGACACHACARFQLPENEKDQRGGGGLHSPLRPFQKNILTWKRHPTALRSCDTNRSCLLRVFPSPLTVFTLPSGLDASRICNNKGLCLFFLFNEMTQNNRFTYAETGVVTGLTPLDLKRVRGGKRGKKQGGKKFINNSCLEGV